MEMPSGDRIPFRAAFFVSADDAAKASGEIKSAVVPAGDVATATHVGPYTGLKESHKAVWDYVEAEGLAKAAPVWEIYVDDPTTVPESELRTEIYRAIGE
jgi:effector-binding domain-containing protein